MLKHSDFILLICFSVVVIFEALKFREHVKIYPTLE